NYAVRRPISCFFFVMRLPPMSTLFPYTTLFRSWTIHTAKFVEQVVRGKNRVTVEFERRSMPRIRAALRHKIDLRRGRPPFVGVGSHRNYPKLFDGFGI